MPARSRRGRGNINIWPGFVDALASLLLVIIFVLLVFVMTQFYLGQVLSGRDQTNPRRADLPAGRRPYWPMRT